MLIVDTMENKKTTFMYFSGSKDALAGYGPGEYLQPEHVTNFNTLDRCVDWRRKLSNFYSNPDPLMPLFHIDGIGYTSVEAYFQGMKQSIVNPMFGKDFALNSGSILSHSSGAVIKKAGRKYKLNDRQLLEWDNMKAVVMRTALDAKFRQNDDLRQILIATRPAVLTHKAGQYVPTVIEYDLMELRDTLCNELFKK